MMCPFTKILNTVSNVVVDEVTVRGRCHRSTRKNEEAHHLQVFLIVVFCIGCRNVAVSHKVSLWFSVSQSGVNDFVLKNPKDIFVLTFQKQKRVVEGQ